MFENVTVIHEGMLPRQFTVDSLVAAMTVGVIARGTDMLLCSRERVKCPGGESKGQRQHSHLPELHDGLPVNRLSGGRLY